MARFDIAPFDVRIGDRILGTDAVVTEAPSYAHTDHPGMGSAGAWRIVTTEGTRKYSAQSKIAVIR